MQKTRLAGRSAHIKAADNSNHFRLRVSTSNVVTGSVIGAGASRRLSAFRWGVGDNIVLAGVLTGWAAGCSDKPPPPPPSQEELDKEAQRARENSQKERYNK